MDDVKKQDAWDASRDSSNLRELYRILFEEAADGMFIADHHGRYVVVNPRWSELTGYSFEEFLEMTIIDLIPPEDIVRDPIPMDDLRQGKIIVEARRIRRKDGRLLSTEISARILLNGSLLCIVHNITERKQAEDALHESRQMLQNVLDTIPVRVFWKDRDLIYLGCNRPFASDAGASSSDEIVGRSDFEMPWKEQAKGYRTDDLWVMETGQAKIGYEESQTTPDGGHIWLRTSKIPLLNLQGGIRGVLGTYEDITDSKQAEENISRLNEELEQRVIERTHQLELSNAELKSAQSRILQQEKMASVGQLAAGVAHEINNPMGFITSNLNSLERYMNKIADFIQLQSEALARLTLPEEMNRGKIIENIIERKKTMKLDFIMSDLKHLIKESLEGADRVRKIVQDLKTFSRLDDFEFKMANINDGLDSTITIAWNELKYKAALNKDYGDIPLVMCNLGQLNQVFLNILLNASQAIAAQGTITVRTWSDSNNIYLSISDTGVGIGEEKINRIFEPFFTTKEVGQGTGLGLSIAYDIIKKHNGEIRVESEVGRGTTFTIIIPIVQG